MEGFIMKRNGPPLTPPSLSAPALRKPNTALKLCRASRPRLILATGGDDRARRTACRRAQLVEAELITARNLGSRLARRPIRSSPVTGYRLTTACSIDRQRRLP